MRIFLSTETKKQEHLWRNITQDIIVLAYLTCDDGVNNSPAVTYHENKFRTRKQLFEVNSGSQGERVFVAKSFGRWTVSCNDF